MSTNLQDYVELLNAEQHVQVDKLREHARHGILPKVRGEVWVYLLNVISSDKTNEISSILNLATTYQQLQSTLPSPLTSLITRTALSHHTRRFYNPTYAGLITSLTAESETIKPLSHHGHSRDSTNSSHRHGHTGSIISPHIAAESRSAPPNMQLEDNTTEREITTLRSQYSRFLPPAPTTPPTRQAFIAVVLEVLGKYYQSQLALGRNEDTRRREARSDGSEANWVYLVTPFVCSLTRPAAMYLGFEKLMDRIQTFPPIQSRLASLLPLFRFALPELHMYFEDEEVPYVSVFASWLSTMLSKEMWLNNILRLWDSYLASDDMFELHCYVCVSILGTLKETLEEMDAAEVKMVLMDLPPLDVDRLLQNAANIRVNHQLPRAAPSSA